MATVKSSPEVAGNGANKVQGVPGDLSSPALTLEFAQNPFPSPSRARALPDFGIDRSAPVTHAPPAARSRDRQHEHRPTRPNSLNDTYSPLGVVVLPFGSVSAMTQP